MDDLFVYFRSLLPDEASGARGGFRIKANFRFNGPISGTGAFVDE